MRHFIVVAYDVEDDKRRRKVAKVLEAVGKRVNKSVFECFLTDGQMAKLKARIEKRVTKYDTILYYHLCKSCIERVDRRGTTGLPTEIVKVF